MPPTECHWAFNLNIQFCCLVGALGGIERGFCEIRCERNRFFTLTKLSNSFFFLSPCFFFALHLAHRWTLKRAVSGRGELAIRNKERRRKIKKTPFVDNLLNGGEGQKRRGGFFWLQSLIRNGGTFCVILIYLFVATGTFREQGERHCRIQTQTAE